MGTRNKKQSLAEKISSLITAAPTNFGSDDDEAEETKAKVVEQFDESESDNDNNELIAHGSSIRRQNVDLLDEVDDRYKGKKVTRKDIYGNDSDDFDDDDDDDDDDDQDEDGDDNESAQSDDESVGGQGDDDDEDEAEDDDDDEDEEEDASENEVSDSDDNGVDDENPLYRKRKDNKYLENITVNNPRDDIEKGNCVRDQLKMWENLLEVRIQLHKCLASSNKLPQFNLHKEYEANKDFAKSNNQTRVKLMDLLDNMLQVQDKLLKINPETTKLAGQMLNSVDKESEVVEDDPMDEEICSDTEDEMENNEKIVEDDQSENEESVEPAKKKRKTLNEYEKILNDNHEKYIPYRNSVIQLWNDKTRVASGNINKSTNQSVVKQIEFILNDKSKIIRKSQLKRSEYDIIGKTTKDVTNDVDNRRNQEYDTEIYDDDDFYHQLLRELIQHKSADVTDPVQLSKQWIQLQNMRNKMKRKVNTKESKGRRIRYGQVHNKLVNFMAPITIDDTWSSLAKTELYNSLFGKIKSLDSNTNDKIVVDND